MLVLVVALAAGVSAGYLTGGRLRNLERLGLARPWLVIAALALQVAAFSALGSLTGGLVVVVLHLASYVLLGVFVVLNRRSAGVVIAGVGLSLNALVIAVNGGHMPASRGALELAGVAYDTQTHNNSSVALAGDRLSFLGDVFAVPAWVPAANVFSAGDVLIVVGVVVLLVAGMRPPAPATSRPPRRAS